VHQVEGELVVFCQIRVLTPSLLLPSITVSMASTASVPGTYRGLVLSSFDAPLQVKDLPFPTATTGSAVVQVLSSPVLAYSSKLYSGALAYPLALPLTIGGGAIGRVVAVGNDATTVAPGKLVLLDPTVRGRDEPGSQILLGVHGGLDAGSRKLMDGEWRNGAYAEYVRVPLENVHGLNEDVLCRELGYTVHDLAYLLRLLVPTGGLVELDVRTGEKVIVAPATGQFGGAAVEVARAMGADVLVCGRNVDALHQMKDTLTRNAAAGAGDIAIVKLTGNVAGDAEEIKRLAGGGADKYLDFSPAAAAKSTHLASSLLALRKGGAACFMGGIPGTVEIPYGLLMFNDLKVHGKFMYGRDAITRLIRLVETGRLPLGEKGGIRVVGKYGLDEWKDAFDAAEKEAGWGVLVVIEPGKGK